VPWGVGSCKVYAPVNAHTTYKIHEHFRREREEKKHDKNICRNKQIDRPISVPGYLEWDQAETIF
jgi:hypothetical protein